MPRKKSNLDDYDNFKAMMKEISRFNDKYTSFTTGKTYTDLLGKTASGLLKDVAADSSSLSDEQKKCHEYSLEVFSAFCAYFCATKIKRSFAAPYLSLAGDTVDTVYARILKRIKNDLEKKGECRFVRNLIACSAANAMRDLIKKQNKYWGLDDKSAEGHDKADDELLASLPKKIRETLIDGTFDAMETERKLKAVKVALFRMYKQGIISKRELHSICHFYGIGDGFKKLTNHEIAVMFKCSDSAATRCRLNVERKLREFIKDTPDLGEELL